jgi:hypothetical protein
MAATSGQDYKTELRELLGLTENPVGRRGTKMSHYLKTGFYALDSGQPGLCWGGTAGRPHPNHGK